LHETAEQAKGNPNVKRYGLTNHTFIVKAHHALGYGEYHCPAPTIVDAFDTEMMFGDVMHSAYGKECI
jgi:hypothetical protein